MKNEYGAGISDSFFHCLHRLGRIMSRFSGSFKSVYFSFLVISKLVYLKAVTTWMKHRTSYPPDMERNLKIPSAAKRGVLYNI